MPSKTAAEFLQDGTRLLTERGKDRDKEKERSMGRIVEAFKAITGNDLSERDGWLFMACVKLVRAGTTATGKEDDYVDGLNYMALAGESVSDSFVIAQAVQKNRLDFGLTPIPTQGEQWQHKYARPAGQGYVVTATPNR